MIPPQTPVGMLMHEHRLILRAVAEMDRGAFRAEESGDIDTRYVGTLLDFLRTYADRCHHGKEEDILFARLAEKQLSEGDAAAMQGLIDDHAWARRRVHDLAVASDAYSRGETPALLTMTGAMRELAAFYPVHIDKEDRGFFRAAMRYISQQEREGMADEFAQFDRRLIEEKYSRVVEELESRGRDAEASGAYSPAR